MDDGLWGRIEPHLPPWPERSPGPRPVDDRLCLQGILYLLHQDIAWRFLPLELGFGSGQTCWRVWTAGSRLEPARICTASCSPS
ncbi:transposase [Streptomyces sp. NPDC127108]|uniref:transposase n=1 Tax=Streptomyces sp. NPDC127108 TaxID=3345361 RepID=UPI0036354BE8